MTGSPKTLIVIAGPTAAGKTAHAINVAEYFGTEIVSADSRQCYKELNIGVARPSIEELQRVPHYFIASHSIQDHLNAAWYEKYALDILNSLFLKHDVVLLCGGTGLYIKALIEGMDFIPGIPADIRKRIAEAYRNLGLSWLQNELRLKDRLFSAKGEMKNPQRMMRALEVFEATGKSVLSFREKQKEQRHFRVLEIILELPRDILYERIHLRVERMMEEGLEKEARQLIPFRNLNALQTVGYQEMFDYFDGALTMDAAVELIKQNTRRYAKRQITWFKKRQLANMIPVKENPDLIPLIRQLLKN